MSKFLVKLVDEAIFPAALLIAAKAIGVMVVNLSFGLRWSVDTVFDSILTPHLIYASQEEVLAVASYSNLIMYIAVFIGIGAVIVKAFYLHDTHVRPQTVLKLAKMDLLHMISSSFQLYHQALIWFGFQLLTTMFVVANYLQGVTYGWVAVAVIVVTLGTFWMLIKDIDLELERKVLVH